MAKSSLQQFGIECGPGWDCLIWPLVRRCKSEGVDILQIKEKYGGLRFYIDRGSDALYAAIDDAEDLSYSVCEVCGEPGTLRSREGGWLRTLCDEHVQ